MVVPTLVRRLVDLSFRSTWYREQDEPSTARVHPDQHVANINEPGKLTNSDHDDCIRDPDDFFDTLLKIMFKILLFDSALVSEGKNLPPSL